MMVGTTQENNIVRAKFTKLIREITLTSFSGKSENNCIKDFKAKINDDEDGALQCFDREISEDLKSELLHLAVNNRKNDFVQRVLNVLCPEPSTDAIDGVQVEGKKMLEKAVLFATLNDDPETLEEILIFGKSQNIPLSWPEEEGRDKHCPVLYACLRNGSIIEIIIQSESSRCFWIQKYFWLKLILKTEPALRNYSRCITLLCRFGYRIRLPAEDKEIIEKMLMDNDVVSNDCHFYMKFWLGERHVDQFYRLSCINLIKTNKRKSSDTDPVERFLKIKAFSNPHYIATEFIEKFSKENENRPEDRDFSLYDPIRKSLVLGRYSKLLSRFYVQYSQEYMEISKRCEELATSCLDHCHSMKDVRTVLEYSPGAALGANDENTNWHLALNAHHKSFVGHHYYQNYLWERITGQCFHWDNFFFFWKLLYIPYAILIFLIIPFVVLLDAIFRSADILFVPPEMMNKAEGAIDEEDERLLDRCEIITEQSYKLEGQTGAPNGTGEDQNTENTSEIELVNLGDDPESPPVEYAGAESVEENAFFSYFRIRIHRPILRIINYHIIEVIFLFSLILTLVDPLDEGKDQKEREQQFHFYDSVTMVFIASYCLESALDLGRRKWGSLSSFWTIYNVINYSILALGGLTTLIAFKIDLVDDNRAKLSGNHPVNVGSTLFALGASLSLLKPLRWFLLNKSLGPVVVCIIKVLKDTFQIFKIFLVVFLAFSVTSYFMFKPFYLHDDNQYKLHQDDLVKPFGLFSAMIWRIFDPGQPHYAAVLNFDFANCTKTETNDNDEYNINCISEEFSHLMGMAIWGAYQALTVILLINILIAMMNTTYHRIWDSSDTQWKYSKSFYQIQFLFPRASLPSPFRILYYLVKIIYDCKKWSRGSRGNSQREKYENYKNKLVEIVLLKVHSDNENSIQDDFSDLKKDLQNHLAVKQRVGLTSLEEGIKDLKETLQQPSEQVEDLKREVRSLQTEIKNMKERRSMEEEIRDLKTLIQTLIEQRNA